jgi:hypothetical protein
MTSAPGFEAFHSFAQWLDKEIAEAKLELAGDTNSEAKQERVLTLERTKGALTKAAQPDFKKGFNNRDNVFALQVALFFIVGSWAGRAASESPKTAYLDSRAGLVKHGRKSFDKLLKGLLKAAQECNMDIGNLPQLPLIDNCGIEL